MSVEIDKRVVEMQFDNKQFERNVQTSLGTLDKLKMALNFDGAKGLDSITQSAKKMDLSNITNQTEKVQVSFSALQVAGMTMVSELTKSFMNFGKSLWNMSFGQIKSGGMSRALKIEQANFKMQALVEKMDRFKNDAKAASEYISDMGDAIDWAVTGTAYGYDAAAGVAAQLMTSGHEDVEQMKYDLRAIAGAAAMAGSSYEDMGRIFTSVAGQTKVMGDQLIQFSSRGLNAASTIATYLHKTEGEVRKMVSKGQIDFRTFANAMYDAYGEAAGRADETYAGVLSNVKAQLSRLGQRFTVPYIENMIPFFQQLKVSIKEFSVALDPIAKRFNKIFGALTRYGAQVLKNVNIQKFTIMTRGIENILWGLAMILHSVRDAFNDVFPPKTANEVVEAALAFERFTEQILPTGEALSGIKGIFTGLFSVLRVILKTFSTLTKYTRPVIVALLKIVYAFTNVFEILSPLALYLLDVIDKLGIFEAIVKVVTTAVVLLATGIRVLVEVFVSLIKAIAYSGVFSRLGDTLAGLAYIVGNILLQAFIKVASVFSSFIDSVNSAGSGTSFLDRMANNVKTLWNLMVALANSFSFWIRSAGQLKGLKSIIIFFEEAILFIKDFLTGNDITDNATKMREALGQLGETVHQMGAKFKEAWDSIERGQLIMMLFAAVLISVMLAFRNLIDNSAHLVSAMTDIPKILGDIRVAIQNIGNFAGPAQTLLAFGGAVAIVTNSILTLSKIPRDELIRSTVAIGALSAILLGFVLAMDICSKVVGKDKQIIDRSAINIAALTGAVLALTVSLKILSELDATTSQVFTAVGAIVSLMAAMMGTMYLLSKYTPKIVQGSFAFVSFASSIIILVKAVELVARLKIDDLTETMATLSTVIIAFGIAIGVAGKASGWASLAISAFTMSVIVLFGMFMILAYIPMDVVENAITRATVVFNAFIPLIMALGVASGLAGKGTNMAIGMAAFVTALTLFLLGFAAFIHLTNGYAMSDGIAVLGALVALLSAFALVVGIMEYSISAKAANSRETLRNARQMNNTFESLAKVIIAMSASILAIGVAAKLMENVSISRLVALGVYIGILGFTVVWIEKLSAKTTYAKSSLIGLVGMLSALSLVVSALIMLQFVTNTDKLWAATAAIGVAAGAVALVAAAISLIVNPKNGGNVKNSKQAAKNTLAVIPLVAAFSLLLIAFSGAVYINKLVSWQQIAAMGVSIAAIIGVMTLAIKGFSKIKDNDYGNVLKGVGALALILPSFLAIATSMSLISKIPVGNGQKALKYTMLIGAVLFGLSTLVFIMSEMYEAISNKNDILKMTGGVAILCLGFVEIAGALALMQAAFQLCDPGDLLHDTIALGILFAEMAAALGILNAKKGASTSADLMMSAGAIAIVASSFLSLAGAFAVMKQSGASPEEITAYALALGIMAAVATALGAVAGYFGPVAIGLGAISVVILSMGAACKAVADGILDFAFAIRLLSTTTQEEVDNAVDAIVRFASRSKEIAAAMKQSFPDIADAIIFIMNGIGMIVGAFIGELAASAIVAFVQALVVNINVILDGIYIILGAIVNWLNKPEVQTVIFNTFAALAKTAINGLAGLFEGFDSIKQCIKDLENWSLQQTWKYMVDDLLGTDDYNKWANAYKNMMEDLSKYTIMNFDEMTDAEKENYKFLLEEVTKLQNEAINRGYFSEGVIKSFNGGDPLRYAFSNREELKDYTIGYQYTQIMRQIYEAYGEENAELAEKMISELLKVNNGAKQIIESEGFGIGILTNMDLSSESIRRNDFIQQLKDVNNQANIQNSIFGKIAGSFANKVEEFNKDVEEHSNRNWIRDMFGSSDEETTRVVNNIGDIKNVVGDLTKSVGEAAKGGAELQNEYKSPIRMRVDAIGLETIHKTLAAAKTQQKELQHDTVQTAEKGLGFIKQIGKGYNIAKDDVDVTVDKTDDIDTEVDAATSAMDDFNNSLIKADALVGDIKKGIGGWITNTLGQDAMNAIQTAMGGMPLPFEQAVHDADYWREYGEKIDSRYGLANWQMATKEDGSHFKDIEDYVNAHASTGMETYINQFGNFDEWMKKAEEDAKAYADSIGGVTNALNEEDEAAKKARERLEQLKDTVASSLDMFSEFNKETELTGQQVLKNFLGQIEGVTEWSEMLVGLANKGVSQPIIAQLEEAGPSSYEKVHAIYNMTSKQIALLNAMSADSEQLADKSIDVIEARMKQMVADHKKIVPLWPETVEEFDAQFKESGEVIATELADGITEAEATEEAGKEIVDKLADGVVEEVPELRKAFVYMTDSVMETLKKELAFEDALTAVKDFRDELAKSIKGSFNIFDDFQEEEEISTTKMLYNMAEQTKKVGRWANNLAILASRGMSEGLLESLRELGPQGAAKVEAFAKMSSAELKKANNLYAASASVPTSAADKLVSAYAKAGYQTSLGFAEGIDPEAAADVMYQLGTTSLTSLQKSLDIHSPSRATYGMGVNTILGLSEGLGDPDALAELEGSIMTFGEKVKEMFDEALSDVYLADKLYKVGSSLADSKYESKSSLSAKRPVTDFSNMRDYISMPNFTMPSSINLEPLKTTLNSSSSALSTISSNTTNTNNLLRDMSNEMRNVQREINSLRTDTVNLGNRIDGMYVRLDGNALVGQIVNPLDTKLGSKSIKNARRRV